MAVIGFFIMLMGFIGGVWRRVENRIKEAKDEAMKAANSASLKADILSSQLRDHELHVAREYVSKSNQREMLEPVMAAIEAVRGAVDSLHGRMDSIIFGQAKTPPVRRTA